MFCVARFMIDEFKAYFWILNFCGACSGELCECLFFVFARGRKVKDANQVEVAGGTRTRKRRSRRRKRSRYSPLPQSVLARLRFIDTVSVSSSLARVVRVKSHFSSTLGVGIIGRRPHERFGSGRGENRSAAEGGGIGSMGEQ